MKAKKSNRTAVIVLGAVAAVLALCVGVGIIGGVMSSSDDDAGKPASVPAYKVVSSKGGNIVVEVDQLPTKEQMTSIVTDLRGQQSKEAGYFVSINCSTGGTAKADNRLGNGRFGIGAAGEARTGLDDGVIDVQVNEGRTCPAA